MGLSLRLPWHAVQSGLATSAAWSECRTTASAGQVRYREKAEGWTGKSSRAGMRSGEIFGLKWARLEADYADIRQRVYRGDIDSPKSVRSVRHAALSDGLLTSIDEWRAVSLDTSADAWVFVSERLITPLAKDNCWRRHFLPKLRSIGLAWANFQMMRRTHSSLLKELDVDPQVRAEQMGHTVDVNENVYTITSLKRRKEAVNALEKAVGA